jgi:hypothetical protein
MGSYIITRLRKIAKKILLASSCLSVRPSVRPLVRLLGKTRLPLDGLLLNFMLDNF